MAGMMENCKAEEVGKSCLTKAKNYAQAHNWARSFPHYLVYFEIFPNNRNQYVEEFTNVLRELGLSLESKAQLAEVAKWYTTGLTYFPGNPRILNNFGEFLLRTDQPEIALVYLKLACAADSNYLLAERNLLTAKLNIIPRWHFRMMNDSKRNQAYRSAIHKATRTECNKVLDIGAGCGLLSFYAAECKNVQNVFAFESSNILCAIANNALENLNIQVINRNSTFLLDIDIGLSDLLITEIFDAGLFGEHALKTITHAWEKLLEPSAKIIPSSADLFITGISSNSILHRHKLCNSLFELGLKNVCVTQRTTEPYEAESLKDITVTYVTNTVNALSVNFADVNQLKRIYKDPNCIPALTLTCLEDGTVDAFAVWFDLHLDKDISITTNPFKESVTCWEQAVIYLDHPLIVQQGQEIKLQISCVANKLEAKVLDAVPNCNRCFKVSPQMISFLNDPQIVAAARNLELPNRFKENDSRFLDLNPFPLFALCMAKKGHPGRYKMAATDLQDFEFLNYVWSSNGFSSTGSDHSKITFKIFGMWQLEEYLLEQSFDVIFVNPIANNGTLSEETFQKLPRLNGALKNDGLILPMAVRLEIEVVDSKYLDFCSKVDGANLFGFAVAQEINEYSVLEQWKVKPRYFQRKNLCNVVGETLDLRTNCDLLANTMTTVQVPVNGKANGLLYWYTITFSKNVHINTYDSFHYNGACFIFNQPRDLNCGDELCINIRLENGVLKIDCDNDCK